MRKGEALARVHGGLGQAEFGRCGQAQELSGFGGQTTANDQVDAAASADFVQQDIALERELGDGLAVFFDLAFVGIHVNDVTHFEIGDIDFDGQCTRVFLGVKEDRCDLATQRDAAKALVGDIRNVLARGPDHAVGR